MLPQRYKFSSKSQLLKKYYHNAKSCCCYRKGTNFQANHNSYLCSVKPNLLLLLPQRYKFSSKSQQPKGDMAAAFGCCCYRKGTNFQANHNQLIKVLYGLYVVATAKVQIFKQITTKGLSFIFLFGCCCYRKGTNFQANHNIKHIKGLGGLVVVATAKVQIFKQITTKKPGMLGKTVLLLLPQRYKFSSKSQPNYVLSTATISCCCYRKGTNFQANHNLPTHERFNSLLLLLPQRYKFSSKSQPFMVISSKPWCCCCYRKGTNFQANHNQDGKG